MLVVEAAFDFGTYWVIFWVLGAVLQLCCENTVLPLLCSPWQKPLARPWNWMVLPCSSCWSVEWKGERHCTIRPFTSPYFSPVDRWSSLFIIVEEKAPPLSHSQISGHTRSREVTPSLEERTPATELFTCSWDYFSQEPCSTTSTFHIRPCSREGWLRGAKGDLIEMKSFLSHIFRTSIENFKYIGQP